MQVTINHCYVYGVSYPLAGTAAMAPQPNLRIWTADDAAETSPQFPLPFDAEQFAELLATKLRPAVTPVTPGPAVLVSRPGVSPTTLGEVLTSFHQRTRADRTESSWSGYRTLLKYWTRHHRGGDGPPVNQVTAHTLQEFFEATPEWGSRRSWVKNRDLLYALLKSACPQTVTNPDGLPADQAALQIDALPIWSPPKDRWFRDRSPSTQKKSGGHRPSQLPLLTVEEFQLVIDAAPSLWWRTFLLFLWLYGQRLRDQLSFVYSVDQSRKLRIDLDNRVIAFTETKGGGRGLVPLHFRLAELLTELRASETHGTDSVWHLPDKANLNRRFYPEFKAIWTAAGVPLRMPHQMRGVAVSNCFAHAPQYRHALTGHSTSGDVQLRHYIQCDERFREAVDTLPCPTL